MKHPSFGFVVLLTALGLLCAFVATPPARADNLYASIRGTVTDPSGAVVPGVASGGKSSSPGKRTTPRSSSFSEPPPSSITLSGLMSR